MGVATKLWPCPLSVLTCIGALCLLCA